MHPFGVKEMMDSKTFRRKVFYTEVMIVVLFGFVVPILTVRLSGYQDNGLHCIAQSQNVLFYAGVIPILLAYITGLMLLFGSFWVLRRVSLMYFVRILYVVEMLVFFLFYFGRQRKVSIWW